MAEKNILIVCSANINRSITAEWIIKLMDKDNVVWSRGSNSAACRIHGGNHCSAEDTSDADIILCMEDRNKKELLQQYGDGIKDKIMTMDIPDKYKAYDADLILEIFMKLPEGVV